MLCRDCSTDAAVATTVENAVQRIEIFNMMSTDGVLSKEMQRYREGIWSWMTSCSKHRRPRIQGYSTCATGVD